MWKEHEKCYDVKRSLYESRITEVDLNTHVMKLYKNNSLVETVDPVVDCIDLDSNGRRWEGGVKDGKPYGFGTLFNGEGRREYEGFMISDIKVCYGKEYFADIERVEYEGCYFNNKRCARGVIYNRKGGVEWDGLWCNDTSYESRFDGRTMDSQTESIEVPGNGFNNVHFFILPPFPLLKRIVIGDYSFGSSRSFVLSGLSELESVTIGHKSFMHERDEDDVFGGGEESNNSDEDDGNDSDTSSDNNNPSTNHTNQADGDCQIFSCPKLKSIQIGYDSFSDYHSFEMKNLPSLQSIQMDDGCFYAVSSFSLTGIFD